MELEAGTRRVHLKIESSRLSSLLLLGFKPSESRRERVGYSKFHCDKRMPWLSGKATYNALPRVGPHDTPP